MPAYEIEGTWTTWTDINNNSTLKIREVGVIAKDGNATVVTPIADAIFPLDSVILLLLPPVLQHSRGRNTFFEGIKKGADKIGITSIVENAASSGIKSSKIPQGI